MTDASLTGAMLFRKIKAAASEMHDHVIAHREYEASLPSASITHWTEEVEAWEKDPSQPNPFEVKVVSRYHLAMIWTLFLTLITVPTQAAVCRQLSEAEARDLAARQDFSLDKNMSPSALISSGIDLEGAQCVSCPPILFVVQLYHRRTLGVKAGKVWAHAQDRQHAKFQLQSNALHRKINVWSTKQQLYIPGVAVLRAADAKTTAPRPPYLIPLWLPSQIGTKIPLNRRFAEIEWQLHIGQAYESLELLRGDRKSVV